MHKLPLATMATLVTLASVISLHGRATRCEWRQLAPTRNETAAEHIAQATSATISTPRPWHNSSTSSTPSPTTSNTATTTVALLVLDDFGLTPLPDHQQQDLYEVICNRYERHATVITSNRDFNEWPLVFANPLMASATMDRLVHRAVKIVIEGKSYRMDSFVRRSRELPQPSQDSQ